MVVRVGEMVEVATEAGGTADVVTGVVVKMVEVTAVMPEAVQV